MSEKKFDFSGYATKNDLKCTDGRVIRRGAFRENDGDTVPLVWQHGHSDPENVLGHAVLENRDDGVYAYGYFNPTTKGEHAKLAVAHGDLNSLSIFANELQERNGNVTHGNIKEVSLVLAGANRGAKIDNVAFAHGDDISIDDTEAFITPNILLDSRLQHADSDDDGSDEATTVKAVFDSMTDEQKAVVHAMVAEALDEVGDEDDTVEHSDYNEGDNAMKKNVFEKPAETNEGGQTVLMHADMVTILENAKKVGSFKEAFLAHADTYGITDIEYLFPDAKTIANTPDFIKRRTEWVADVLNGVRHTPFSRIKSVHADITADEARAKGYVKGTLKKEEVIKLLRRVTTPKTIYKKQKLDRDDIIDITDFDVVVWLKAEMRLMLDEEIARAILIGDGREAEDADKINEENVRPIWKDDDMYVIRLALEAGTTPSDMADAVLRSQIDYEGSGSLTLFASPDMIIDMLLVKDTQGRRLYNTEAELMAALGVSRIVRVPLFKGQSRVDAGTTYNLNAIMVNLQDYAAGADRGGQVSMFDDFDIDYNQEKYLIETRLSGALTKPKSAIVVETKQAAG